MIGPRSVFGRLFSLTIALAFGQPGIVLPIPPKPSEGSALCKLESLPSEIQNRLKEEYGSWKIQEPTDLSQRTRGSVGT
jgi:hypothetical protein